MIDISPADEAIVNEILKKYVPKFEVRVFGSRHKWTTKPYSDLDIAIVGDAKLDKQTLYVLQEAFEESELNFRVDVLDWYAISDEFRAIIEQGYTVIQEKDIDNQLPAGWRVVKLGDVIDFNPTEKLPKGSVAKKIAMEKLHPYTRKITNYEVSNFTGGSKFKNRDTLLARITPCLENGKTSYVDLLEDNEIGFGSTEFIVLRKKENITDSKFIYYLSISPDFRDKAIKSMTGSSGRQRVQSDELMNHAIAIPPLDEQKKIAAILSSLDDKIELNQQINKKLEEMAQSIFKEWFIDFNFPDENGNPYRNFGGAMIDSELGLIPATWSVGKLVDEFSITMGQSPAGTSYNENSEGMIFFQGRTDFGIRFPSIRLFTTEPKRIAKKFDILLSVRAPVGDINIALQDCCIGRGLAAINSEDKSYCYYKLQWLKNQFDIYNGTGTVFGAINKDQLNGLNVVMPNDAIIKSFEGVVSEIDGAIYNNHLEILALQDSRDTLLPKLMAQHFLIKE